MIRFPYKLTYPDFFFPGIEVVTFADANSGQPEEVYVFFAKQDESRAHFKFPVLV